MADSIDLQNLTRASNEALLLSVLYKEKKHGYQIALDVEERSRGYFKFNHGTLYPILHKLEKDGYIKGTWKQEGPKRKRKYYTLSAKGRKYIKGQIREWKNFFKQFSDITGDIDE